MNERLHLTPPTINIDININIKHTYPDKIKRSTATDVKSIEIRTHDEHKSTYIP